MKYKDKHRGVGGFPVLVTICKKCKMYKKFCKCKKKEETNAKSK